MTKRVAALAAAVAICVASLAAQASPILILISFDGWRGDYIDRANVPNLKALAARGVRSEGLIPSFPTVAFPNHDTIVTGLLPDHHGIVGNGMFDRTIGPEKFTMASATAKDPRWWGGADLDDGDQAGQEERGDVLARVGSDQADLLASLRRSRVERRSAAVLGLTDVDALTMSMTRGIAPTLSPFVAAKAIAVGVLANRVMKLGLALPLGAPGFRAIAAGALALMLVAIDAALLLIPG